MTRCANGSGKISIRRGIVHVGMNAPHPLVDLGCMTIRADVNTHRGRLLGGYRCPLGARFLLRVAAPDHEDPGQEQHEGKRNWINDPLPFHGPNLLIYFLVVVMTFDAASSAAPRAEIVFNRAPVPRMGIHPQACSGAVAGHANLTVAVAGLAGLKISARLLRMRR